MPANGTSSVLTTSTSSPQTMSSVTNTEEPQKADTTSTDSSSSSTASTPSTPPPSSPTSSSSSSSNPPPLPSPPPSHSPTPPPSTPSPSPPAHSPSNPTSSPSNSPPTSAPAPPSDSSSGTLYPSTSSSEAQAPGTTVPNSAPSSPAASSTGPVTNNITSSLTGSPSTSPTSSPPHGAPITAVSTVLITTQAGGEIVTLTTVLSDPTLSTNTLPGHSGVNTRAIAAASVIGGLAVISVAAWGLFTFRRKRRRYHIERDSATAAMVAAGVLPPPFHDSTNVTPNIERGSTTQYFEDGTPITSILEPFNPYAYPAVGLRTSSNGTSVPSGVEFSGSGPKRSPSERSAAVVSVGQQAYEPISRSQSPPDLAAAAATVYPPTAFNNLRRSMRSSNSSSEDSHSQGHTSFVIPQQPPQPQPFASPVSPSSHSHSHSQVYTYPHVYVSNVVPAGTSPPGSGNSHEDHEAMTIPLPQARSQNQLPHLVPRDLTPDETPEMQEAYHLLTGTPAGIPVSSSEISIGYGNGGEGYGSLLTTRPRLEIRNRTGSFKTTNSETSKNDAPEK